VGSSAQLPDCKLAVHENYVRFNMNRNQYNTYHSTVIYTNEGQLANPRSAGKLPLKCCGCICLSYILTRLVSDPPMTFMPRPDFPLQIDIRVGRPGSTGRSDGSSSTVAVPHGNKECNGDKSGDVSDDSTLSSDNAGYLADGTVYKVHGKTEPISNCTSL